MRLPSLLSFGLAALLALLVAIRLTTPPAPLGKDAPPASFSAGRAMKTVREIARAPHPSGSAELARVRGVLVARLRALGLDVAERRYPMTDHGARTLAKWGGPGVGRPPLVDIVARWPGRDRAVPALLLMAHYDTVWGSPGATDDSFGVATLMEDVRAMRAAGAAPARDVMLLFTDGEEVGLAGAERFFERDPLARRIGMVVNHESRGGGGRTAMFETGRGNAAAMALFARSVPHPVTNSLAVLIYRAMPNNTDLTVAQAHGLFGFNFAFIGRASLYHSPLATPDAVESGTLQDMGDQSLGLARALATVSTLPAARSDATFFDLLGLTTIVYPPAWGWLVIAAAAGVLAYATVRLRAGRALLPAILSALFLLALAAALLTSANALSTGPGHPEYFDRLAALHRLELQAALLCLAACAATLIAYAPARRWQGALAPFAIGLAGAALAETWLPIAIALPATLLALALPRKPLATEPAWIGLLVLLLGIAGLAQAFAPTAAAFLAWPALLGAIGAALAARFGLNRAPVRLALILLAAIGGGQTLALAHLTFSGVGAPIPLAMLPYLLILAALFRPLVGNRTDARALQAMIATMIVAALLLAAWVRFDPPSQTVPVYVR